MYAVHAGTDRVIVVETWADRSSPDAHGEGDAPGAIAAAVADALAEPLDIAVVQPFPVGESAKGPI